MTLLLSDNVLRGDLFDEYCNRESGHFNIKNRCTLNGDLKLHSFNLLDRNVLMIYNALLENNLNILLIDTGF